MGRSVALGALVAVAIGATFPSVIQAGSPSSLQRAPGYMVPLYAGKSTDVFKPTITPSQTVRSGNGTSSLVATSTILVTYHNFPANAQAAFQAAVDTWQSILVSNQVIHVDASWADLGSPNILGQAGATHLFLEGDGFWYPSALEEARCSCDADTGPEIVADFNSTFSDWYLSTDGNVPNDKWDFETVVLHELGHGLGFFRSFWVEFGQGYWGYQDNSNNNHPLRYDANEWDSVSGGGQLINASNGVKGSSTLKTKLTNGSVYLGGTNVEAAFGGRIKLYAPSQWSDGSSNSHLDESSYPKGNVNALMTPILYNGEALHTPGAVTVAIFQDMGWTAAGSATTPEAPSNVVAAAGDTTADVSWTAPASNGGSAISGYTATSAPGGLTCSTVDTTVCTVGGLTNGTQYTFTVTATNASGTGPASAPSNPVVPHVSSGDLTAPGVGVPFVSIVAPQNVRPTELVNVSWPPATDDSGIASYELQSEIGAGPWVSIALGSPTATSAQFAITRGSNYSFRVRATDGANNVGPWTTTTGAILATVQETSPNFAFTGSWTRVAFVGASGRNLSRSLPANDAATFTFTGSSVAFVSTMARARGIAEITLDGVVVANVDLYAPTRTPRAVVWAPDSALAAGTHTVTIRVTGAKNPSATKTRVDVDAFLVWP